jgi:hypothetical protein
MYQGFENYTISHGDQNWPKSFSILEVGPKKKYVCLLSLAEKK